MTDLPSGVKIGAYNEDKLREVYDKLRGFNTRFGVDDMKDPEVFLKQFLARDSMILEHENGIMFLQRIIPGLKAEVHVSFWDHKLSAHKDLFRDCLLWAFITFNLERIETYIGAHEKAIARFLSERMNFTHEGTLRNYNYQNGRLIDIGVYSILKQEVL